MKTLAVINQKGGVGKSTTAQQVGAALRLKGYRVLFIDLDAQGNLTYSLGAEALGYGALGVLERPETIKDEIQHLTGYDVVASTPNLATADTVITETGKEYRLKEALKQVTDLYDYCIVDTPPALGILTINALTACYGAVVPAQADIYSLQGIGQLYSTIEAVQRYCNPQLKILGVVLTRYNPRTIIGKEVAEQLEAAAEQLHTRLYKTTIRTCISLVEAQAVKKDIFTYAPKSNAAKDYSALTEEIIESVKAYD